MENNNGEKNECKENNDRKTRENNLYETQGRKMTTK